MFLAIILVVNAVLLGGILAALALLTRRAHSVDPVFVVKQLDEALIAIREDIQANAGLTQRDVDLLAGLLRIGRRQVINDVLPRLRAVCSALGIDDREDFEQRSPEMKALITAMGEEMSAYAQGKN
jgi:hypothetical protein